MAKLLIVNRAPVLRRSAAVGLEIFEEQEWIGGKDGGLENFTTAYCAPEVVTDRIFNLQADIWALGCVVAQMATGLSDPWKHAPNEVTPHTEAHSNVLPQFHRTVSTDEFPQFAEDGDPCLMCHLQKGEHPPIPDTMGPDGCDFLEMCWKPDPQDRLSAVSLTEHQYVRHSHELSWCETIRTRSFSESCGRSSHSIPAPWGNPTAVNGFSQCLRTGELLCDGETLQPVFSDMLEAQKTPPFVLYSRRQVAHNVRQELSKHPLGTHLLLTEVANTHRNVLQQLGKHGMLSLCISTLSDLNVAERSGVEQSMWYLDTVLAAHSALREGFLAEAISAHANFLLYGAIDLQWLQKALQEADTPEQIQAHYP